MGNKLVAVITGLVITVGAVITAHAQSLVNGTYQFSSGSASIDGGFACWGTVPAVEMYPTNNAGGQYWIWNGSTAEMNLVPNPGTSGCPAGTLPFMASHDADNTVTTTAAGDAFTIAQSGTGSSVTIKDNRTGKFVSLVTGNQNSTGLAVGMSTTATVWSCKQSNGSTCSFSNPTPPVPVSVQYTPASPSLVDSAAAGATIASYVVTTNPASTYSGANTISGDTLCAVPATGNGSVTLTRALTASDVGSHTCTAVFTENSGMVSAPLTFAVTAPPPPPVPTAISFSPASPSLTDNAAAGATIASFTVTTNPASTYNGTNSLSGDPLCTAPASGNGNVTLARALTSADDGSHSCTLAVAESGTSINKALSFAVAAPPPMPVVFDETSAWTPGTTLTSGLILHRISVARTITGIVGNITLADSGAIDLRQNSCSGTKLNMTSLNLAAAGGTEVNMGVASSALSAGDKIVLCPSGMLASPNSAGSVTISVK